MIHRSHPAPRCPGVGPINATCLTTLAVRWAVEARKRRQTPPSDHQSRPDGVPRDQNSCRSVPRLTHR